MEKISKSTALSLGLAAFNLAIAEMPDSVVDFTSYSGEFTLSINSLPGQTFDDFCEAISVFYAILLPNRFSYRLTEHKLSNFSSCSIAIPYE